jgi:hypothetical protein
LYFLLAQESFLLSLAKTFYLGFNLFILVVVGGKKLSNRSLEVLRPVIPPPRHPEACVVALRQDLLSFLDVLGQGWRVSNLNDSLFIFQVSG